MRPPLSRAPNGSDAKLHGQGPRAEARAARGAPHLRRANARRVTPRSRDRTSRLGRRAEAGPCQLLRRVRRPIGISKTRERGNLRIRGGVLSRGSYATTRAPQPHLRQAKRSSRDSTGRDSIVLDAELEYGREGLLLRRAEILQLARMLTQDLRPASMALETDSSPTSRPPRGYADQRGEQP